MSEAEEKQQDSVQSDRQREGGGRTGSSPAQLSLLTCGSRFHLAMSSGLHRKWRRAVRALRTLRGTAAAAGGGAGGAVSYF